MTPNIVAIGGGNVLEGETESIDRVLIELSGKEHPHLLFIPTASEDAEEYVHTIKTAYGRLGCDVSALRLLGIDADPERAAKKIDEADAIYVGGGNTKALMQCWRHLGVDKALRRYLDSGRPAGGLSAGAICWFRIANSDWPQFENIPDMNTAPLECLGFVDLAICPHTRDEGFRLSEFCEMMTQVEGAGVGLDDGCAIQIRGDEYRILSSMPGSVAHLMYSRDGIVEVTPMPPHNDFRRLENLRCGVI